MTPVGVPRFTTYDHRAQEHPRHADIQTTTVYTKLTQSDLPEGDQRVRQEQRGHVNFRGENFSNTGVVAPTGFEPVFQP